MAVLLVAACLAAAHYAAAAVPEHVAEAARTEDATAEPLLRRWRLDNPLPAPLQPLESHHGSSTRTASSPSSSSGDEELEDIQHYPARRSLHWLPSGLGTNWDLHGESSHPVRHGRHHRGKHHRATTEAPAVQDAASDAPPPPPQQRQQQQQPQQQPLPASAEPPPPPTSQQPNKTLDRFLPLALSADFASRGAVADVVVDERPRSADDIHVRPAMDDTCYSSNQVLIIIAMTCMLSLGFIALVMGCVHCCTANVKAKEYETFDTPFLQLDHCDLGVGPRSPRGPRGGPKHKAGWMRKLHHQPTRDADPGNDSEEELLFHAASGPVASPSLISLHSLQSARERGSSMSMEDLLLLGRCR